MNVPAARKIQKVIRSFRSLSAVLEILDSPTRAGAPDSFIYRLLIVYSPRGHAPRRRATSTVAAPCTLPSISRSQPGPPSTSRKSLRSSTHPSTSHRSSRSFCSPMDSPFRCTVVPYDRRGTTLLCRRIACRSRSCRRDRAVQARVQAAPGDQLLVCALIFDHPLIQNNDSVHPFECGNPVRDEEDRFV